MSFADILEKIGRSESDKLAAKLPSWAGLAIEVPASLNYQQCSSEATARYKASLVPEGARVADLTGGLGADSWAFSLRASAVWYNERDSVLLDAVKKNFAALGISNVVFNEYDISLEDSGWQDDLRAFPPDVIYLDPARRDFAGKKVFLLEDCSPDVVGLMPLLLGIAPLVMVKVSPMADITMLRRRLSGWLSELHVVGSEGECKELLCLCRRDASFRGIVLAEDGHVLPDSGVAEIESGGELLFVPSAAMVKSGLGPGMCMMLYNERLALFGKYWQVIEDLPFASSVIKNLCKSCPKADVTARGVPLSSEELRRRLRVAPGGPIHIFACTLSGERRLLVCRPAESPVK